MADRTTPGPSPRAVLSLPPPQRPRPRPLKRLRRALRRTIGGGLAAARHLLLGDPDGERAAMSGPLPLHVFTIVLNGMPFIRHHVEVLRALDLDWHWHIVEGVAALRHDTAWSLAGGGRVPAAFADRFLSTDGTSDYLDGLVRDFPGRVHVYRKDPPGPWDGKLEMIRQPLRAIATECLLWQIDADELWTTGQIMCLHRMFRDQPHRSAAHFLCHYFVGPDRVISSLGGYGNHPDYEWRRVWRFRPGDRWHAHEPPRLMRRGADGECRDVGDLAPFEHAETEQAGLVFQHFAYAEAAQIAFKEDYFGYRGALAAWHGLQGDPTPRVRLADRLPWVHDQSVAVRSIAAGIAHLASRATDGRWSFAMPTSGLAHWRQGEASGPSLDGVRRVLVIKLDAIGDWILATPFLRALRHGLPEAHITVLASRAAAPLATTCPYADRVLFLAARDRTSFTVEGDDAAGFARDYDGGRFDLAIVPRWDVDHYDAGRIATGSRARLVIGHSAANLAAKRAANAGFDAYYTHVLCRPLIAHEIEHHLALIDFLGLPRAGATPELWTTRDDEAIAAAQIDGTGDGRPLIALCPGASIGRKTLPAPIFAAIAQGLAKALDARFVIVGGPGEEAVGHALAATLGAGAISLCGALSLRQSAAALGRCGAVLAMCSAPGHMAAARGRPVAILSAHPADGSDLADVAPTRFRPAGTGVLIIQPAQAQAPCTDRCRADHPHCITGIDPEDALARLVAFFREQMGV